MSPHSKPKITEQDLARFRKELEREGMLRTPATCQARGCDGCKVCKKEGK